MASLPTHTSAMSADVLHLVFEQLAGDYGTLTSVGLVCRAWRSLSLPCLLQVVDLSTHNLGRLPQFECAVMPYVFADMCAQHRPVDMVPRQRAFLRLMTARPDLSVHVRALTWTLLWLAFDDRKLSDIDYETWNVLSRLRNVRQLDLASLHSECDDHYVRQNPAVLFPGVVDLRLLGWMHRGLVRSILGSLNSRKLHTLRLDFLDDEGSLPDVTPIDTNWAGDKGPNAKTDTWELRLSDPIPPDLVHRQENGEAFTFAGPMWLPLHILLALPLDSLTLLQVKIAPFDREVDNRNYHSLFQKTAETICKTAATLETLVIVCGEYPAFYPDPEGHKYGGPNWGCGTGRMYTENYYRPWCIQMALRFLNELVAALGGGSFPRLITIQLKGFKLLETARGSDLAAEVAETFQRARACPYIDLETLTAAPCLIHRKFTPGNECNMPTFDQFSHLLASS